MRQRWDSVNLPSNWLINQPINYFFNVGISKPDTLGADDKRAPCLMLETTQTWKQGSLNPPGIGTTPCSTWPQHPPGLHVWKGMTQSCHSRIPYTAKNTYKKNILPNILFFGKRFRLSPVKILSFGFHYTFLCLIWRLREHDLKWPYFPFQIYVATSKLKLLFKNSYCFFVGFFVCFINNISGMYMTSFFSLLVVVVVWFGLGFSGLNTFKPLWQPFSQACNRVWHGGLDEICACWPPFFFHRSHCWPDSSVYESTYMWHKENTSIHLTVEFHIKKQKNKQKTKNTPTLTRIKQSINSQGCFWIGHHR